MACKAKVVGRRPRPREQSQSCLPVVSSTVEHFPSPMHIRFLAPVTITVSAILSSTRAFAGRALNHHQQESNCSYIQQEQDLFDVSMFRQEK